MATMMIFLFATLLAQITAQAAPIKDAVAALLDAVAADAAQALARDEKLASQGFFQGWSSSGETGGALSALASFQLNNDSNPPAGRKNSDTTNRVTPVYSY